MQRPEDRKPTYRYHLPARSPRGEVVEQLTLFRKLLAQFKTPQAKVWELR
jgi:hypothetical protein